jgi:hypothetical protein
MRAYPLISLVALGAPVCGGICLREKAATVE